MRFRPYPPRRGAAVFALDLAPRSLYVLAGEARWQWQHGIAPTPALRHSITFRTMSARATDGVGRVVFVVVRADRCDRLLGH
jgi:hypothetical protein